MKGLEQIRHPGGNVSEYKVYLLMHTRSCNLWRGKKMMSSRELHSAALMFGGFRSSPLMLLSQVFGKATTLLSWSQAAMQPCAGLHRTHCYGRYCQIHTPVSWPKVLFTGNSLPFVWLSSSLTVCIWSIYVFKSARDDGWTTNVWELLLTYVFYTMVQCEYTLQ